MYTIGLLIGALLKYDDASWTEIGFVSVILGLIGFVAEIVCGLFGFSLIGTGPNTAVLGIITGIMSLIATIIATFVGAVIYLIADKIRNSV